MVGPFCLPSCAASRFETESQRMGAVPQHGEGPHASPSSSHREVCPGTRLISSINVLRFSDYRGNTFNFSPLNMMLPLCLLYMAFIMLKCFLYTHFVFYHKWMLSVVICAFCIYWDDHMIFFFNLLMWYVSHWLVCCCSVAQSCPTLCNPMDCSTLGPPSPSPSPRACSNSCPNWVSDDIQPPHPLSSPSFFCLQSFPASLSILMNQLFASGGQSVGASRSSSVLQMSIQDWFLEPSQVVLTQAPFKLLPPC